MILVTSQRKKLTSKITLDSLSTRRSFRPFLRLRTLYLNRYLRGSLLFLCLWRLVSFHICKASRRSSKFCLPVADLHLSSFFLPRPPSTTPDYSCLSRSSFSYRGSRFPRRTHLHLLVLPSDLWVAENWPKRSRKNRSESELPSSFSSSSTFSASSFSLPSLRAEISCAPTASREKGSFLLGTSNGYLPNYFGVGFLWVPERSPWTRNGNRNVALPANLSRIPNLRLSSPSSHPTLIPGLTFGTTVPCFAI